MLNYAGLIMDTVKIEIFFKRHKERILIDVIRGQKWGVILDMPWLACHNPEIDWKTGEVQMIRCLEEYGKKWKRERQTKPGQKKQKEKEEKKEEFRRPITEEEMAIVRIVEEKEEEIDEEEDLIKLIMVKEMVPRWFHKYLKVFEKKESERMLTRKIWDYAIDLKEGFVPKKKDIFIVKSRKRGGAGVYTGSVEKEIYQAIKIITDITGVLCAEEGWKEEDSVRL